LHSTLLHELLISAVPESGGKHVLYWAKALCITFVRVFCAGGHHRAHEALHCPVQSHERAMKDVISEMAAMPWLEVPCKCSSDVLWHLVDFCWITV